MGESLDILKNIELNGWVGPARLVPYIEREIRCVAGWKQFHIAERACHAKLCQEHIDFSDSQLPGE